MSVEEIQSVEDKASVEYLKSLQYHKDSIDRNEAMHAETLETYRKMLACEERNATALESIATSLNFMVDAMKADMPNG